jgi:TolB-like protein
MQELVEFSKSKGRKINTYIAWILTALGDKDGAIDQLEKADEQISEMARLAETKVEPFLQDLRSEPRFITLLKKIGLLSPEGAEKELQRIQSTSSIFDKKRIAILPFANISPDPNDEYFADGMTEELISTISEIQELAVILRTSIMQYKKNVSKRVGDLGRDLYVGCVIEGSARKAGNRVRVAVQLIEVESDKHLWAHSYDASLEDIFSVQSEIARNVAESLRVKLLPKEEERIEKVPTLKIDVHEIFLKGIFFFDIISGKGF